MKSLEELAALREKVKPSVTLTGNVDKNKLRVVVGMATCGMAAGAKPIFEALKNKVKEKNLDNVSVVLTGCMGICKLEPLVEVYQADKDKVTYVNVTPEMVERIVADHFENGKVVEEYTVANEENL